MAQILGRYGLAREDGYFKQEQEADIQVLRRRLIDQGRFTEDYLGADAFTALRQSPDDVSPVLMEVLQASARMDVPNAARHRIWELRKRAGLPPLPEAELARAVRQLRLGSAALLVPAELSLSTRQSWRTARASAPGNAAGALPPPSDYRRSSAAGGVARGGRAHVGEHPAALQRAALSPEQQLLADRQAAVALRSAAYGTMAGVAALGLGATAFAASCGVWSVEDAQGALRRWGRSWRDPIRAAVLPWAAWARALAGRPD
eukprot:jgi/Ulvmu1/659/UM010_0030.1